MYSKARTFSHIYVEKGAAGHPRTSAILERFPKSRVVEVDDYQNVFGRGRQDFWRQKRSPKLILGIKKDNLLYMGNAFLQSNSSPNFAYNAPVLNCPYDCHYCYLQGMYSGANIVAFVNQEDFFEAAEQALANRAQPEAPMPLAISYDTDLLALEGILGFAGEWIHWARSVDGIILEIRTKSAPMRFIREVQPTSHARLVWTLSPEAVCRRYETGTPSLRMRLKALQAAAAAGWKLHLCVDPVLRIPGWREHYCGLVERLKEDVPWQAVDRVEIGVFRVSSAYFKRMKKRPATDLLHYPYEHANKAVSYNQIEREELGEYVYSLLSDTISTDLIHLWT